VEANELIYFDITMKKEKNHHNLFKKSGIVDLILRIGLAF